MKKLFTLLFAIVAGVAVANDKVKIGDFCYYLYENDLTAEVTFGSIDEIEYSGDMIIPSSVTYNEKNYSVTGIAYGAFSWSALTSIEIPNSVTSIGREAFNHCGYLTSVNIPNSVTSIGTSAFAYCDALTTIDISNNVTDIADDAFESCGGLTSFNVATDNPNYCSEEGVLFNKDKTMLMQYPAKKSGNSYVVPNTVTILGISAFAVSAYLKSVELPDGITRIGWAAFFNCPLLNSINIPNSVTTIEGEAFERCTSLTSIEIPNSVTNLGQLAFSNCSHLASAKISNSITRIGNCVFYKCSALTSIEIPNGITIIDEAAFGKCTSLTSVTIPNSVTSIMSSAFEGCSSLTSIAIPNCVINLGYFAFMDCTGLTSITCEAVTPPNCDYDVFRDVNKSIPLYVPAESVEAYKDADQWKDFTNIQAMPKTGSVSGRYKIGSLYYILDGENMIAEVSQGFSSGDIIIPASVTYNEAAYSVTSIGDSAFYYDDLRSITIPSSVIYIGKEVLGFNDGLASIVVNNENTIYDSRNNCNAIIETASNTLIYGCKNSTIPNGVTCIGENAFANCRSLTSITVPNSVTSIEKNAFFGCNYLVSVTIPNSVTSIGERAFSGCPSLTSFTIPNGVEIIHKETFAYSGLISIVIPNSVRSIEKNAFSHCYSLTSVTIPKSVTSIGEWAFDVCVGLTSITCEAETPPTLDTAVFVNVDKSIPLYVPAGSVDAYKSADQWKDFMNIQAISVEGIEQISQESKSNSQKLIKDGNIFILRGDKVYTLTGKEL